MSQTAARIDAINHLTGKTSGLACPIDITASDGGGKFSYSGEVLRFPGNTFICHIDKNSTAFTAITGLQAAIANGPSGHFFTYLPPKSFHMTVFSGVHGGPPWHEGCPRDLDPATDLAQITNHFKSKVPDHSAFETCRIVPGGLYLGHSLTVVGATQTDRRAIQSARETLQSLTQIMRPDYETYRQHISLCYQIAWMTPGEAEAHLNHADQIYRQFADHVGTIDLGPVEYCAFDDMHHFEPLCLVPSSV